MSAWSTSRGRAVGSWERRRRRQGRRMAAREVGGVLYGPREGWCRRGVRDGPPSEGPPTSPPHNIAHLGQPLYIHQSTRRRRGGRGTGPATTRYSPGAAGTPPRRRRGHPGRRRRGHSLRVTGGEVVRVDGRSGAKPHEIAQGTARATSTDVSRGRFWWGKKSPIQKWSGWPDVLVHSPHNAE